MVKLQSEMVSIFWRTAQAGWQRVIAVIVMITVLLLNLRFKVNILIYKSI